MSRGLCGFLWQLSVALYLLANGVLGLQGGRLAGGVFRGVLGSMFRGDTLNLMVTLFSIIAFVAGIALLLEMFNVELSFLPLLVLIVAIVWVVFIVISLIAWIGDGFGNFFQVLANLAVYVMVLASLLTASKRFG